MLSNPLYAFEFLGLHPQDRWYKKCKVETLYLTTYMILCEGSGLCLEARQKNTYRHDHLWTSFSITGFLCHVLLELKMSNFTWIALQRSYFDYSKRGHRMDDNPPVGIRLVPITNET